MEFYDAVLVVSFGGPESPEQVRPFLEHVTRGRGIPAERLDEVAQHYLSRGGVSPINQQVRDLISSLNDRFRVVGVDVPIHWGNRNSAPWLAEAIDALAAAGHRRVLAVTTSAYPSYSGCRQYRENLWDAASARGIDLDIDVLAPYAEHPAFIEVNSRAIVDAATEIGGPVHLAHITHSIPQAMADASGPGGSGAYVVSHRAVADQVTAEVRAAGVEVVDDALVYCSRSGPPHQPWLVPDINDHLRTVASRGVERVVLAPMGFTSDHMEVVNDLDDEAMETAASLGITAVRARTVGTDPAFVAALADLILDADRAAAAGTDHHGPGSSWEAVNRCTPGCCRNLRDPEKPAVAER